MQSLRDFVKILLIEQLKTTHWGVGGAGIVFVCPEEEKIFLQKRSSATHNGAGKWAFPGGGIHPPGKKEHLWPVPIPEKYRLPDSGPIFYRQALEEIKEECGSVPVHQVVDTYLYIDRGFKYRTFVATITAATKADWHIQPQAGHAWESEKMGWFTIEQFDRADLFFGFTPGLIGKVKKAATR